MLQACVFPICNEHTKCGDGGFEPCFYRDYEDPCFDVTTFVGYCHEYETDIADDRKRMRTDLTAEVKVRNAKGGSRQLVRIAYDITDTLDCDDCKCRWCATFLERNPDIFFA